MELTKATRGRLERLALALEDAEIAAYESGDVKAGEYLNGRLIIALWILEGCPIVDAYRSLAE